MSAAPKDVDLLRSAYVPTNYTPANDNATAGSDDTEQVIAHLKGIDDALASAGGGPHEASHLHGGTDEIDGDKLDVDYAPTNYTSTTVGGLTTSTEELTSHLKGIDTKLGTLSSGGVSSHASTHIQGAADEIDGDKLDMDFSPTSYTPTTAPTSTNTGQLASHLKGIDLSLAKQPDLSVHTAFSPTFHYRFDGLTVPADDSGNGNTPTLFGSNLPGPTFDGVRQVFLGTCNPAFGVANTNGAITIEFVTQFVSTGGGSISCGTTAGGTYWQLTLSTNAVAFTQTEAGARAGVNLGGLWYAPPNNYYHMAATRASDGKTIKIYVQGLLTASGVRATAAGATGSQQVATTPTSQSSYAMVAVYPAERSAADIMLLYKKRFGIRW